MKELSRTNGKQETLEITAAPGRVEEEVTQFVGQRNLCDAFVLIPGQGVLLILATSVVTAITALSMSAISTNGVIKGGESAYK
jgi:hypothetical protein